MTILVNSKKRHNSPIKSKAFSSPPCGRGEQSRAMKGCSRQANRPIRLSIEGPRGVSSQTHEAMRLPRDLPALSSDAGFDRMLRRPLPGSRKSYTVKMTVYASRFEAAAFARAGTAATARDTLRLSAGSGQRRVLCPSVEDLAANAGGYIEWMLAREVKTVRAMRGRQSPAALEAPCRGHATQPSELPSNNALKTCCDAIRPAEPR
jgi:hypothetical protein